MGQVGAQRGQLTAQRDDPAVPGRGIRGRGPGIADGVGQAGGVGVRRRPARRSARSVASRVGLVVEFDGSSPQRGDVATAQPPPRPGEHPHRGGACGGIGRQTATSPPRRRPRGRPAARPARRPRQGRRARQARRPSARRRHCGARAPPPSAPPTPSLRAPWYSRRQMVCDPIAFGRHVGQQRAPDDARLGVGPWPQLPHRDGAPPRLRGHRVRQMQRPRRIAPAGAQLQRGRRACRPPRGKSVVNRGRLVADAPRQP